jgi:hypothetical protein
MNISDARGSDYFFNSFVSNSVPPKKSLAEARMANAASTPAEKADLLQVERRWLSLARSYEAKIRAPSQGKPHRKGGAKD